MKIMMNNKQITCWKENIFTEPNSYVVLVNYNNLKFLQK